MGQIKNIKLHIVTDIKATLVQSTLQTTENGPSSICHQCRFRSSISQSCIQSKRWKWWVNSEISKRRSNNWSHNPPCCWFWRSSEHVEILHRRFSRYQSWSRASSCYESALHRLSVHAAHLGKIYQILKKKIMNLEKK